MPRYNSCSFILVFGFGTTMHAHFRTYNSEYAKELHSGVAHCYRTVWSDNKNHCIRGVVMEPT